MSREGARCRERERVRVLEDAIGNGATLELLGVPFVVLFAEPRLAVGVEPEPRTDGPSTVRPGRRPA